MYLDLHIHSCYSKDCSSPVGSILAQALHVGLGAIAICDHDTIEGSKEAEAFVEENGLDILVIPGIEVTTNRGHVLILGIRQEFPKNRDPEDIISTVRQQGGMIIAAHPFKGYPKSLGDVTNLDVDAIETLNSRFVLGTFNKRAEKMATVLDLPMLGNSDAHVVEMVGRAYTEIDSEPTIDSVFKAIRSKQTTVHGTRTPLGIQLKQACCGITRRAKNLL